MGIGMDLLLLSGIAAVLLVVIPIRFEIDTRLGCYSAGWLFLALGNDRGKGWWLSFLGLRIHRRRAKESPDPSGVSSTGHPSKADRLIGRLASEPGLALRLVSELKRFLIRLSRGLRIARIQGELSFDDPMINGICFGIVRGLQLPRTSLAINFEERNWVLARFQVRPYRTIIPILQLLATLPYRALFALFRDLWGTARAPQPG